MPLLRSLVYSLHFVLADYSASNVKLFENVYILFLFLLLPVTSFLTGLTAARSMAATNLGILSSLIASGFRKIDAANAINEANARLQWNVDSRCSIYSRSLSIWCDGQIVDRIIDEQTDEEWLVVQYGKKKKRMQRFSPFLRPLNAEHGSIWNQSLGIAITERFMEAKVSFIRKPLCPFIR